MPFHNSPKLKINVLSEAGKLSFARSRSSVISYTPDDGADARKPTIVAAQRLGTGEALDAEVWELDEIQDQEILECIPGVRLFELIFKGRLYTQRLRQDDKVRAVTRNLYRSITSKETIRLMIALGERRRSPLEVELSYELSKSLPKSDPEQGAAC